MIAWLAIAFAQEVKPESDVSVTSVGVQFWQAPALAEVGKTGDADVLLGQRLRWALVKNDNFTLRARADARFTLSPNDDAFFKRNRVRQLAASFQTRKFTLEVGRSPVHKGGPRLVDGVQMLLHPSSTVDLGFWGGLAPDLFTTEFRGRFGGGPIVSYAGSRMQLSLVGEFLMANGGIDRVATLAQARFTAARTIEISGRIDSELLSVDGGPHLSDGQVFVRWAPVSAMRVDAFYDVFSSYRYQRTENLDPDIQRFDQRLRDNDPRLDAVLQDCLEPKVAQAVGTNFQLLPTGDGVAPLIGVKGRYRFGGQEELGLNGQVAPQCGFDDINSFVRVNPQLGLVRLPIAGRMDVAVDANYYIIDGRQQSDAGITLFWEPSDEGVFAFDTSYRVLLNPYDPVKNPRGYDGLGHYADAFVDLVIVPADLMVGTGLNVESEPGLIANDLGVGAFLRVTKYIRKRKKRD